MFFSKQFAKIHISSQFCHTQSSLHIIWQHALNALILGQQSEHEFHLKLKFTGCVWLLRRKIGERLSILNSPQCCTSMA